VKHDSQDIPGSTLMQAQLEACDVKLSDSESALVLSHLAWVLEQNKTLNLTAITEPLAALRLHVIDSLCALKEVDASPAGPLCDIGTGGGFPGVPLGIATSRETLLVDSVGKKVRALQQFLEESGLSEQMSTLAIRAEDLALSQPERFAVVTMRAVSQLPSLVELAAPLLVHHGRFVALKGPIDAAELARGERVAAKVGLEVHAVRRFELPQHGEARTLVTYVRTSSSKLRLPRRTGLAQSKPLA